MGLCVLCVGAGHLASQREQSVLISVRRIFQLVSSKKLTSYSVVPNNHGIGLPPDSGLKILTESDVVIKELQ